MAFSKFVAGFYGLQTKYEIVLGKSHVFRAYTEIRDGQVSNFSPQVTPKLIDWEGGWPMKSEKNFQSIRILFLFRDTSTLWE